MLPRLEKMKQALIHIGARTRWNQLDSISETEARQAMRYCKAMRPQFTMLQLMHDTAYPLSEFEEEWIRGEIKEYVEEEPMAENEVIVAEEAVVEEPEVKAAAEEITEKPQPKKRGRKPGSKNQPKKAEKPAAKRGRPRKTAAPVEEKQEVPAPAAKPKKKKEELPYWLL